jgi:hypothetical protein
MACAPLGYLHDLAHANVCRWRNRYLRRCHRQCLLWMAPVLQEVIRCSGALVGCSLLSGLFMQPFEAAGPDGVGELGPNLLCRL